MSVSIEVLEDEEGDKIVNFVVKDLDNITLELSDSNVNDIKVFFDRVFDYIITEEKLIEFELNNTESNLFYDVASDIIDHLNNEITQSESNFIKLNQLKSGASLDVS